MSGIIQKKAAAKAVATTEKTMQDYIKMMSPAIRAALPKVMTEERFTRIVLSSISANPALADCTTQSFLGAMMSAAQLGLECNTPLGEAYLIPYRNHGKLECQFQLGYKGLLALAQRSGKIKSVQSGIVHENDTFEYELGLEPKLRHVPVLSNRGKVLCYYVVIKTTNGGEIFDVMSIEDVEEHAKKYSKSYNGYSSPWKSSFDAMALKTVLRRALKFAPLSTEYEKAVVVDNTVRTEITGEAYSDIVRLDDVIEVDENTGEIIGDVPEQFNRPVEPVEPVDAESQISL